MAASLDGTHSLDWMSDAASASPKVRYCFIVLVLTGLGRFLRIVEEVRKGKQ